MNAATGLATVKTYNLQTANGRHIRKATMVTFEDGFEVKFMERMTNNEARRQAAILKVKSRLAK